VCVCVCVFVFQSSELKREKGYSCLIQDVCAQNNRNTKGTETVRALVHSG